MGEVFILVPGNPFGKQSVRVSSRGGFARKYMPKATVEYEAHCANEAALSMNGMKPFSGAVELKVQMFFPIPKSWSKKKREQALLGRIVPTKKPDSSNVLKSIEDGFTGVVWDDDCQVVDHHLTKRFAEEPCVIAIVTELDLTAC